ncbi:MAG TPA: 50S ribosomal protein L12 [Candidatus Nanoarchaeia archaeon]|nr:50S ribosomal protein L12 [Candidatus Nanoarchaeia archaeon]
MEYIYTAMLLHKLGKPVNEENVKKTLQAAGGSPEEGRMKALVAALDGVDIDAAIKEAAIMPAATQAAPKAEEKKKEEKKDDTQAAAGLGALFG